jgi:hypothetical protein
MLRTTARKLFCAKQSSVSSGILEAGQIADWIIEQIEHTYLSGLEGRCEAASYDLSGNCWKYFNRFSEKVKRKDKIIKLMEDRSSFLHLDDLCLDDFDALIISRIIKFKSSSTQLLDLNNNPLIKNEGLSYIARNVLDMRSPVKLRSLFMSNCGISDEGIESLVAPLSHPEQSLHILELRKNSISDNGAEVLAKILSYPSVVTPEFTLFLNGNTGIGSQGAVALAKAVVESQGRLKVWMKDTCGDLSQEDKADISKFTKNHIRF